MAGLHAGDDAQVGEPAHIGGIEAFDVHDLMPGVVSAVVAAGGLEAVQRGANTPIAGTVDERLQASLLELDDELREVFGCPEPELYGILE